MFMKCPANESRVPIPMGKSGKWSESDLKVICIIHHPTSSNINIHHPMVQHQHPNFRNQAVPAELPSYGLRGMEYRPSSQWVDWRCPGHKVHTGPSRRPCLGNMEEPSGKKKTNFWGNMKYLCGKSVIKTEVIDMWYQLITCDIKVCPVLFPLAHGPSRSRHHRSRQGKARNHHDHPKMEKGHREPWSGATVRESPKFQKLSSAPSEFTTSMVWNSKMAPFSVENPSSIISVPQFSQGADEKVPGSHLPPRRPKRCGFYHETMGWDQFLKL